MALAITVNGSVPARAQTVCPAQQRADLAEEEGLRLRREGFDDAARVLFRQSYELCHGARALVRMAAAEGALGQWLEADTHLREGSASDDPWVTANRTHIEADQQTVAGHLGELELLGTGPEATLLVEDRPAGNWPRTEPLRVLAGAVTFTVQAEGYVPVTRTVTVQPREIVREQITLETLPEPVAAAPIVVTPSTDPLTVAQRTTGVAGLPLVSPIARHDARGPMRTLGWVSAVTSGMGLVTGTVASVIRVQAYNGYVHNAQCSPRETVPSCGDLYSTFANAQTSMPPLQVAGFTVAGVLAATSAVLFWRAARRDEAPRSVAWQCGGGPGVFGASCGVAFP